MTPDIFAWWLLLVLIGRATAPALSTAIPFAPHGFAKPVGLLALTTVSWWTTSLGIDHDISLACALGGLGVLWLGTRKRLRDEPSHGGFEEAIFAGAFLCAVGVRALSPAIFGAEKFMDFAFFNACLTTDSMPPEDPWLSGSPINYYYFGYLLFANLARLSDVAPETAYHLSLATVSAILFTGVTAIARHLTGSIALGLAGGVFATFAGNLDGAFQLLEGRGIAGFDYWRSSRIVPGTINEFPFFSLLHGDLHPHVTGVIPFVVAAALAIAIRTPLARAGPRLETVPSPAATAGCFVLTIAAVLMTNPWDLPVVLLLAGLALIARARRALSLRALVSGGLLFAAIVFLAALLTVPFQLHFAPPLSDVGWVHSQTRLIELGTVFGALGAPLLAFLLPAAARALPGNAETRELTIAGWGFAAVVLTILTGNAVAALLAALLAAALLLAFRRPGDDVEAALVPTLPALAALLACEMVFLRDSYGADLHRMNTVFKLYFDAWILLAAVAPFYGRAAWNEVRGRPSERWALTMAVVALLVASAAYPVATTLQRARRAEPSLDGLRFLERSYPDDAAAIDWLRQRTTGRPIVLEATGNPYSEFARVSAATGLPTVLGWANHENLWRAGDPAVARRKRDIEAMYAEPDLARVDDLFDQYDIRYVFVGELELRTYDAEGLGKFERAPGRFPAVFRSAATTVYEVR